MSSQPYHIKEINEAIDAGLIQTGKNVIVQYLCIDSRSIVWPLQTLFFCLVTKRNNGHKYITELYKKGVRNFVISDNVHVELFPEASFLKTDNTLKALQNLAAYHRKKNNLQVIAITGSNGKTIVKEWLFQLLYKNRNIVRSPKSYNSQIGVPLSVWQISTQHELGIFEAGISFPGEMEKLEEIINPEIVIVTNISEAHLENFDDKSQLAREKLKLAKNCKVLVYREDYAEIKNELANKQYALVKKIGWSNLKFVIHHNESDVNFIVENKKFSFTFPFIDEASIENAVHCFVILLHFGYSNEEIISKIKELVPVGMRLEIKKGVNNCTLINDSYNSDLISLGIALDLLNQQHQHTSKTLILSDVLQSGKSDKILYKEIASLINKKNINRLICVGEKLSQNAEYFKDNTLFFNSTNNFLSSPIISEFVNEAVLVKGARVFEFEKIINKLQLKKHETVLEIDLTALVNNFNYFKSILQPQTKVMAMVKAFSYGAGTYEIANALQHYRVDYLAVAFVDEGVELRKAGITIPIMVMNPEISAFENLIEYNLEPEIYSFRILHAFTKELQAHSISQPYPIHLKIDTGMHRLGFVENETEDLINRIIEYKNISVASVFSHLSSSDEPQFDEFTQKQITLFTHVCNRFKEKIEKPFIRHILNSNGIIRFPHAQFDMVRIGIGLFGITSKENRELQQVTVLKSTISQIKKVHKGNTIGYSRSGLAENDITIAIIPIGYADGFNRKLGNGKWKMLVNGKTAPTIGNICMDMCMLNITDIQCAEGDEVIIFNEKKSIIEFSEISETIPYETLTSISPRVKRNFYWS